MSDVFVLEIKEYDKKRSTVKCESGESFVLYKGEIHKLGIEVGCGIDESTYQIIISDILDKRAKKRVLHLLEQGPKTEHQLMEKLIKGGYPQEVAVKAIDYAKSFHYVDDSQYAMDYVRYSMEKKSRQTIKQDLQKRGISKDIIELAIEEEYVTDETEIMRQILQKKHYDGNTASVADKQKMYRYLAYRGYNLSSISEVLRMTDY